MWDGIFEFCDSRFNLNMEASEMKGNFCSFRKGVSIYLGVKKHVYSSYNSGRTEEELVEMKMDLYKVIAERMFPNGERKEAT